MVVVRVVVVVIVGIGIGVVVATFQRPIKYVSNSLSPGHFGVRFVTVQGPTTITLTVEGSGTIERGGERMRGGRVRGEKGGGGGRGEERREKRRDERGVYVACSTITLKTESRELTIVIKMHHDIPHFLNRIHVKITCFFQCFQF